MNRGAFTMCRNFHRTDQRVTDDAVKYSYDRCEQVESWDFDLDCSGV